MCVVSKPQIPQSATDPNKPLPILRNQMLDGMLGNIAGLRAGRDSLRIPLNPLGIPVGGGGFGSGSNSGGSSAGTSPSSFSGGSSSSSSSGGGSGGSTGSSGGTGGTIRRTL